MPKLSSARFAMLAAAMLAASFAVTAVQAQAPEPPKTEAPKADAPKNPYAERATALLEKDALDDNFMGPEGAPVTIVEYSSLTCGHCAAFHKEVFPKLKEKYVDNGKVRYILRQFPLDDVAVAASMLARCAGPMRYFPFVDLLYAKQEEWAVPGKDPLPELLKFAKQAGFTEDRFKECLSDTTLEKNIRQVAQHAGTAFNIRSTPTFFVNGELVKGAANVEAFEKVIDAHMKD
jgi:protein-disulfide isomerase